MRRFARPVALAAVAVLAGCGGSPGGEDGRGSAPPPVVSAAASLREALGRCGGGDVRLSFAGSDEVAAQIRQGLRPDVLAAANTDLPRALHREGLVGPPQRFATNELVLAVPAGSPVRSPADLARPGTAVAIGSASVPVGLYTRELLDRIGGRVARAIRANVRSEEPDVRGVVAKLTQGAADAGFVYASDVAATGGRLRAVRLPQRVRPAVAYAAAVVGGARRPAAARAYIEGLRSGRCARALRAARLGAVGG